MTDEFLSVVTEKPLKKIRWNLIDWVRMLFIVLLSIGLGGASYWVWQTVRAAQTQIDQNQYDIQQMRQQLDDQSEPLAQLLDQMNELNKNTEGQQISQRLLEEQQHDTAIKLDYLTERFNQFTITEKTDWLIAEIENLLKLAGQHIELTYDVNGAIRLLDRSAELSRSINEVGALDIRQAILEDRHQLASIGQVDVEGIFLELGVLANQVPRLGMPVKLFNPVVSRNALLAQQNSSKTQGWQSQLNSMWLQLTTLFSQHLVRVRKLDAPIQPLLPPEQRVYLNQNLILLLEQAQLAALRHEARSYALSLSQAQAWIESYFDPLQSTTQDMLVTLKRLQSVNIHPIVPQLTTSVNALQSFKRAWSDTKKQRQLHSERIRAGQEKSLPTMDKVEL